MTELAFGFQTPGVPEYFWPNIELGETADFTYDAYADLVVDGVLDPVVSATFSANPSGAGELAYSQFTVTTLAASVLLTVWLSGATVSGRTYTCRLTMTTQAGRTLVVLIGLVVDPVLETVPVPPPANPSFGTPVTWP